MAKRILICAALILGGLAHVGLALPDLVVRHLEIQPVDPQDGDLVTLTAVIANTGRNNANERFFVRFAVDDRELDLIPVASLASDHTETITTTWRATAGPHTASAEVDAAFDRIDETDEENNTTTRHFNVLLGNEALAILAPLRIAVARFDDTSSSGFVHVSEGVSDELAERLTGSGLRILGRAELDAAMQANGLNPLLPPDIATTGRLIGADLLILGSVTGISVQETSMSLGFLRFDSASVDVGLSAQIVDARSGQRLSDLSAEGQAEGSSGFSIDLGELLSFLSIGSSEICDGGLQADRAWYSTGQTVVLGHRNVGDPGWFGVEIHSASGTFLQWLGWEFIDTDECAPWFWDQRNMSGVPVNPGIYNAKLWDGTSYIDTVGFQVRPGLSLSVPEAEEITVGSAAFDETVVGTAMNRAIDRLAAVLLLALEDVVPLAFDNEAPMAAVATLAPSREGQIAAILPDGRIAINLGASSGVAVGDVFEVLEVENLLVDPVTNEILGYSVVSVKGEIRIVETRDQISYAVPTSSFAPIIGDLIRSIP